MKLVRPAMLNDAALVSSNVPETDYTAWSSGPTYAARDRVRVVDTNVHRVFESIAGGNFNHDPMAADGATYWLSVGATNRWAMLDGAIQSQTTNPDSIAKRFIVPGRADSLALFNLSGTTARATLTDAFEGVVYDKTFSLVSDSGITDWYAWLFEPVERKPTLVIEDMPPYAGATLDVTVSAPGGVAACGELVVGFSKLIGRTQWGPQLGINDRSGKTSDDFGKFTITKRAYSRLGTFTFIVPNTYVDQLQELLASLRATPILYIGSGAYTATALYGYFKTFQQVLQGPTFTLCSIDIESLT